MEVSKGPAGYHVEAGSLVITFDGEEGAVIYRYNEPYHIIEAPFVKSDLEDLMAAFNWLYHETKEPK